ncbi:MAG: dihydrolipoyl dehydrogenase [Candidatus Omnitrophota bacterium]
MYDLCVIGSGWGGVNAASEAVKHNLSVCLVERGALGGTCLNYGCIPTKALVASVDRLSAVRSAGDFGVDVGPAKIDFDKILARKNTVVDRLRQGLEWIIKTKKIELFRGNARLVGKNEVAVDGRVIKVKNIVIASGSRPRSLPDLKFDNEHIISSRDLLELRDVPRSLLIIGGGVIGCEFAGIYAELGTKVTIVEVLDRILAVGDSEVSRKMQAVFRKKGITVLTGKGFKDLNLDDFDKVLLSVGRSANLEGLGLDAAGVAVDGKRIVVGEYLRTNVSNIYAVGDCNGGYQLAHIAAYEGRVAVENILGRNKPVDFTSVPNCIFTSPPIASVGLDEEQARENGRDIRVCRFNFLGLGMAHIKGHIEGFVKLVVDSGDNRILGAVIFGAGATEIISTLGLAIKNRLTAAQVYDTIFPHPTLSESISEAAGSYAL